MQFNFCGFAHLIISKNGTEEVELEACSQIGHPLFSNDHLLVKFSCHLKKDSENSIYLSDQRIRFCSNCQFRERKMLLHSIVQVIFCKINFSSLQDNSPVLSRFTFHKRDELKTIFINSNQFII